MLLTLSKVQRTHITNLVRMINSTYNQVRRNIEILEDEGIVKITQYGNMRIVELQRDNQKTMKLLKSLRTLQINALELANRDTQTEDPERAANNPRSS